LFFPKIKFIYVFHWYVIEISRHGWRYRRNGNNRRRNCLFDHVAKPSWPSSRYCNSAMHWEIPAIAQKLRSNTKLKSKNNITLDRPRTPQDYVTDTLTVSVCTINLVCININFTKIFNSIQNLKNFSIYHKWKTRKAVQEKCSVY